MSSKLKENQTIWYFDYRFLPPTKGKYIHTVDAGGYTEHIVIEDGTTHKVYKWDVYATLDEALVAQIKCLQACVRNKQKEIKSLTTQIDAAVARRECNLC